MEDWEDGNLQEPLEGSIPMPVSPMNPGDTEKELLARVRTGDSEDWWDLAGEDGLPESVAFALLETGETGVIASLAQNPTTPRSVLTAIIGQGGDLADLARTNANAPADLKDESPIGDHSQDSIERYLADRQATPPQRRALLRAYESAPRPGGTQLGEAWATIAGNRPQSP